MVKRREVVRILKRNGFVNMGGAKHDTFKHPDGRRTTVPRHQEIIDDTFEDILKQSKLR